MQRIALAVLTALFAAAPAAADPWPIKNFQVVEMTEEQIAGDTGGAFNDAIDAVVGAFSDDFAGDPARAVQRGKIEDYLRQCAEQLETWGFPPPALGRVVELENGELAYRVYALPTVSSSKYYPPDGGDGANAGHLRLHLMGSDRNWRLDFQAHATIAHELFHAVQWNTQFFSVDPDSVGNWITEGQAEAVGGDLAWIFASDAEQSSRFPWDWGGRSYSRHLAIAARNPGGTGPVYETSSFWRYLAELDHRRRLPPGPQLPPGIAADTVHYGYLAFMLSRQPVPRDCQSDDARCPEEIAWLNASLRGYQRFGQLLRRIYPQFAVALAAYGEEGGRAAAESAASGIGPAYWRLKVFGGCSYARLTSDERSVRVEPTLRFSGVSATCVEVTPEGFGPEVSVVVDVTATDAARLNQIVIGVAGDQRMATPLLTGEDLAAGATRTSWPVRLPSGQSTTLVFANVAPIAQATLDQELTVTLTVPGSDTSASREGVPTNSTGNAPPRPSPSGELRDDADGRRVRAGPRLTSNGPATSQFGRRPQRDEMTVSLFIVSDGVNAAFEITGRSGAFNLANAVGAASGALTATDPVVLDAQRRASALDGSRIDLTFPLIDYGFTGVIEEAEVHFSRAQGGRLEAIGPTDADPGPRRDMRPSGRVTIVEYTPEVLRGSFSADLVDPTENLPGGLQPSYAVVRSVEGDFWIASPWREDERMEVGPSASLESDAVDDMVTVIPDLPPGASIPGAPAPAAGSDAPSPPASSPLGAIGMGQMSCECSCAAFDRLQELSDDLDRSRREASAEEQALIVCSVQCASSFASCIQR